MAWGIGWGIAKVGGTDITATVAHRKSLHCIEKNDIGALALKIPIDNLEPSIKMCFYIT